MDPRPRALGRRKNTRQRRSLFFGRVGGGTKNWETGGAVRGAVVAGRVEDWKPLILERFFPGGGDGALVSRWHWWTWYGWHGERGW